VKIPILLKKWKRQKYIQTKIAIYIVITCNFIIVLQSYYNENTIKKEKDSKYWVHTFTPSIIFAFQTNQVQNFRRVLIITITIVTKVQQVEKSLEGYSKEV